MKYWTKSWNVINGCTKCRAGCVNCWALEMTKRMAGRQLPALLVRDGEWSGVVTINKYKFDLPLHWKKPQVVAVNWMSDTFHSGVPPFVWPGMLAVMSRAPQHKYLVLTKRYGEMVYRLNQQDADDHIWMGVTISNKADADEALIHLQQVHFMGYKTWVSFEPALEAFNWAGFGFLNGMVCGPETGRKARPMPIQAAIEARDFCVSAGIPFTFKTGQLGQREWRQFPDAWSAKDLLKTTTLIAGG